jgi:lincosamide nucleotidyltransferase
VLIQQRLIAGVREVCHTDERLDAALMYGSFASGEADAHSDVEFWLFFLPQWHGQVDPRAWCTQIAPVTLWGSNTRFGRLKCGSVRA